MCPARYATLLNDSNWPGIARKVWAYLPQASRVLLCREKGIGTSRSIFKNMKGYPVLRKPPRLSIPYHRLAWSRSFSN